MFFSRSRPKSSALASAKIPANVLAHALAKRLLHRAGRLHNIRVECVICFCV